MISAIDLQILLVSFVLLVVIKGKRFYKPENIWYVGKERKLAVP
jgi:hypothetical protein